MGVGCGTDKHHCNRTCTTREDSHEVYGEEPLGGPRGLLEEKDKCVVEDTWATAKEIGFEAMGSLIFKHLFELAPDLLRLFPFKDEADIYKSPRLRAHAIKFMVTVDLAVADLHNSRLVGQLQLLALRHVRYGVLPEHYVIFGQALVMTIRESLVSAVSAGRSSKHYWPIAENAWLKVWDWIAATMIGATVSFRFPSEPISSAFDSNDNICLHTNDLARTWTPTSYNSNGSARVQI